MLLQDVLSFLENRKENRSLYKGSRVAVSVSRFLFFFLIIINYIDTLYMYFFFFNFFCRFWMIRLHHKCKNYLEMHLKRKTLNHQDPSLKSGQCYAKIQALLHTRRTVTFISNKLFLYIIKERLCILQMIIVEILVNMLTFLYLSFEIFNSFVFFVTTYNNYRNWFHIQWLVFYASSMYLYNNVAVDKKMHHGYLFLIFYINSWFSVIFNKSIQTWIWGDVYQIVWCVGGGYSDTVADSGRFISTQLRSLDPFKMNFFSRNKKKKLWPILNFLKDLS